MAETINSAFEKFQTRIKASFTHTHRKTQRLTKKKTEKVIKY